MTEAGDLVLVVGLAVASGNVALGPLAEAGGDLLGALPWVLAVVTLDILEFTTLAVAVGATMGQVVGIVVAALLLVALEGTLHAVGGVGELGDELVLALPEGELLVQQLGRESDELVEALERVLWWHLLLLGGGNGKKDGWGKFHLVFWGSQLLIVLNWLTRDGFYTRNDGGGGAGAWRSSTAPEHQPTTHTIKKQKKMRTLSILTIFREQPGRSSLLV